MRARIVALARCILAGMVLSAMPVAQEGKRAKAPPDPYTAGGAEALEKAGYASLAPFAFGYQHGTAAIEELLGDEPLMWIETAHFRIGSSVAALPLRGGSEWTDRVKLELKALKQRLPKIKPEARDLDPWLRTHLIALRCEALYDEIQALLGATPAQFAAVKSGPVADPRQFYGFGPHLGMAEKFGVLVVHKNASLSRYARKWHRAETRQPSRHYEPGSAMTFVMAEEAADDHLLPDLELHTVLVYNLAFQLYNAYRHHGHDLPPWLSLGLAHWHSRRISPRFSSYDRDVGAEAERRDFWQWDERARGLLRTQAFEAVPFLMARTDVAAFGMEQHIQAWALVDWLMRQRRAPFVQFVHELKDPFHGLRQWPSADELQARQAECLQRAFGQDAPALELAWRASVLRGR